MLLGTANMWYDNQGVLVSAKGWASCLGDIQFGRGGPLLSAWGGYKRAY